MKHRTRNFHPRLISNTPMSALQCKKGDHQPPKLEVVELEIYMLSGRSKMQKLLLHLPLFLLFVSFFDVVAFVLSLVSPYFACIGCWIDMHRPAQEGPLRFFGMLRPIAQLDDPDPLERILLSPTVSPVLERRIYSFDRPHGSLVFVFKGCNAKLIQRYSPLYLATVANFRYIIMILRYQKSSPLICQN